MRQAQEPSAPGGSLRWWWMRRGLLVAAAVGLVLLLRGFVVQPRLIISESMAPALRTGDRLVMEKLSYRLRPPRAGDILVFELPLQARDSRAGGERASIKRVIALPGQEVEVRGGQVLVDGQALHEPYLAEPPRYTWGPARVPEGMLFVLGDDRNGSSDSHVWGFLPRHHVLGQAWLRFWPPARAGSL